MNKTPHHNNFSIFPLFFFLSQIFPLILVFIFNSFLILDKFFPYLFFFSGIFLLDHSTLLDHPFTHIPLSNELPLLSMTKISWRL